MDFTIRQIIGVTIWWIEGSKSRKDKRWKNAVSYPVEVTNTNPEMIQLFLDFLRNDIGVQEERLKIQIQIHEDNDKEECEQFWSQITKIPRHRFNQTIVRPIGKKKGKTKGTCKIRYIDKDTYSRVVQLFENIKTGCSSVG